MSATPGPAHRFLVFTAKITRERRSPIRQLDAEIVGLTSMAGFRVRTGAMSIKQRTDGVSERGGVWRREFKPFEEGRVQRRALDMQVITCI